MVCAWNRAAEEIFGIPAAEAVKQPCAALRRGVDTHGTPVCSAECPLLEMADQGLPVRSFDLKIVPRTGPAKWVKLTALHTRSLERGLLLIHLARDIALRKRLESVTRRFLAQIGALTGQDIEQLPAPIPVLLAHVNRKYFNSWLAVFPPAP
jgi:PAS domain-containing protein